MYINVKKHILSDCILWVALVKIIAAGCEGLARLICKRITTTAPDMLDQILWYFQLAMSGIQILAIAAIFYSSWSKLKHYMTLIPKDDQLGMGNLQKEVF